MEENKVIECKKENTIPADKAILHLHEKHIGTAMQIKIKQSMYKG